MDRRKVAALVTAVVLVLVAVVVLWPRPDAGLDTSCATGHTHGTITGPPMMSATRGNLSDLWIDYQDGGYWFAEPPAWWTNYTADPYPVDVWYRGGKEIVAVEGGTISWSVC